MKNLPKDVLSGDRQVVTMSGGNYGRSFSFLLCKQNKLRATVVMPEFAPLDRVQLIEVHDKLLQLRSVKSDPECTLAPSFCTALDAVEVARMRLDVHTYKCNDVIITGTGRRLCTLGGISPSATVVYDHLYVLGKLDMLLSVLGRLHWDVNSCGKQNPFVILFLFQASISAHDVQRLSFETFLISILTLKCFLELLCCEPQAFLIYIRPN